jgi:hypothetical protein
MRLNKQQKIALSTKKFCEKYLKPGWDGCAANDYFANRYDGLIEEKYRFKPRTEFHHSLKEIELVESTLNGVLAPLAFTKEKIVTFLNLLKPESVFVPESISNKEEYVTNYLSMASRILENINKGNFDFQRS